MIEKRLLEPVKKTQGIFMKAMKSDPASGAKTLDSMGHVIPYSDMAKDLAANPQSLDAALVSELNSSYGPKTVNEYKSILKLRKSNRSETGKHELDVLTDSMMHIQAAAEAVKRSVDKKLDEASAVYDISKRISESIYKKEAKVLYALYEMDHEVDVPATSLSTKSKVLLATSFTAVVSLLTYIISRAVKGISSSSAMDNIKEFLKLKPVRTAALLVALTWATAVLSLYTLAKISKEKDVI